MPATKKSPDRWDLERVIQIMEEVGKYRQGVEAHLSGNVYDWEGMVIGRIVYRNGYVFEPAAG